MRSRQKSLKVPWPLDNEMKLLCNEEGFDNENSCWIAAGVFFCLTIRRRHYIRGVANSNPKQQSVLIDRLFSIPHNDPKAMVRWLESIPKRGG